MSDTSPATGTGTGGGPATPEGGRTVEDLRDADLASAGLGIELLGFGAGWARTRMTVRPDMANGYGIAHGAFVFAVADTAFACACNSHGPATVAAGADVEFVAPARVGDERVAEAHEAVRYGRRGVYDITVRHGGRVVAVVRGRSATPRARPVG